MSDAVMNNTGYKKNKLGCFPEDWSITMLMDIVDDTAPIVYGIVQAGPHIPGGVPYIKTTDLSGNSIDSSSLQKTSKEIASKYSRSEVIPGDLVIGLRGDLPNCLQVPSSLPSANLTQGTARIRVNSENHSKFILYSLFAMPVVKRINAVSKGSTFKEISLHDLRRIQIALPPFREQQKIASILSTWDDAIQKAQQLIEKKQQLKKGLMQQLLAGKVRLKKFQNEGKWRISRLEEYFTERKETGFVNLPLLSVGQLGVYPQDQSNKKDTSNTNKQKYKRICPGDIGYNTMRMWQGRSALSDLEGIVSPAYTIVTPKGNANPIFFAYLFKTPHVIHRFYRNSQGLTSDTLNCKFKDFKIVKVLVPPALKEQEAIATIFEKVDKEIEILQRDLEFLEEQKKGLMQQLLTGKIRVKVNQ